MRQDPTLSAEHIVAGYGQQPILQDINIEIPKNKVSVILGANGCGKSTLLKTFSRLLSPKEGQILLDGKKISEMESKKLAQTLGLLPQTQVIPEGIRVTDLVARGRYPYRQFMKGMTKADFEAIECAMKLMGVEELANQCVDELSGGQRQRVWIALALAQQTDILLLDEPTTFLDIAYQVEILDLLTDLNRTQNTTIVMVLHDINLSARYADHIFAMKKGNLVAEGEPSQIITPQLMKDIYGLDCSVITDPISGAPMILPMGRHFVDAQISA